MVDRGGRDCLGTMGQVKSNGDVWRKRDADQEE